MVLRGAHRRPARTARAVAEGPLANQGNGMATTAKSHPPAPQLFYASLIATGLVYAAGTVLFSGMSYFGQHTGGLMRVLQTFLILATFGAGVALALAFVLIAPIGTAFALAVLRIAPARWWQGPLTGALVAVTLEALVLGFAFVIAQQPLEREGGNAVMLGVPVILAMIAGGIVQNRILKWPSANARTG